MKKIIFPTLFLISLAYIGYTNKELIKINKKFLLKDPGEYVLNSNIPKEELIDTFYNPTYGTISLRAGTEEFYGLRHILARHTKQYFINYSPKNDISLFNNDVTGRNIVEAIKEFYKHCVDAPQFNFERSKNTVYIGFVELNKKRQKCLLVVNTKEKSIVTFYPFEEKEWKEQLDVIERMQQIIESQKIRYFD